MLGGIELLALNTWCGRRDISWSPAGVEDGPPVMVLKQREGGRAWQRMMLVMDTTELRLENELGETLASASDLPALLDAVEGGVADLAHIGQDVARVGGPQGGLAGFIL